MPASIEELRQFDLFSDLSDDVLGRIARLAVPRNCAPGETILWEGDPGQNFYLLRSGRVRVYRLSPEGREQVFMQLEAGQCFNLVPFFHRQRRQQASAQALDEVSLYALDGTQFRRLVQEHGELALAALQDMAGRLERLTDLAADLSLRSVRGRLARFLLQHAESRVAHGWTQEEIAAYVGTVRDVVGRTLRTFAQEGLVQIERERIILLDREGLEEQLYG
ncbi:MAG: Crp/Fnr family transcriptional regulator [Chloroflexia bacterium]|nr:Crp/Fnr family transcriptional regulator [Chloroflexia bacterium]